MNTKTYAIMYTDGTYHTYDLTEQDFTTIQNLLINTNVKYAMVSIGLVGLENIRSVIEQNPEPEDKGQNPGFMSEMEKEWLREQKRLAEESNLTLLEGEEVVD